MPTGQVSMIRRLFIAGRPWSFPASTIPVLFGAVLAVTAGGAEFKPVLFAMSFIAMVLLHAGSNVINDIVDWNKGLDVEVTPVSGAIIRGYFNTRNGILVALAMMAMGCGIGLILAYLVGISILIIGVVGVAFGVFYSVTPLALKYRALGDLSVFMDFGILGSLGSWTVQTGHMSPIAAVLAIPLAMLVVGILHANNWRDISGDTGGGIKTIASILGDKLSLYYYGLLIFGPFVFVIGTVISTHIISGGFQIPFTSLIILLALPAAIKLWKRALMRAESVNPEEFILLDKGTAELNLIFGLLYTASLILGKLI